MNKWYHTKQEYILYNKKDRRRYTRFNVPGAIVKYDEEKGFQGSKGIKGQGQMIDLTVYAVKFTTNDQLTPGSKIKVWITLNNKINIPLMGNVLWIFKDNDNQLNHATVEFMAFSEEQGFNSIESKKALEKLSEKYEPAASKVVFNY